MSTYQGYMPLRCLLCPETNGVSAVTGFCARCDNKILANCDIDALSCPIAGPANTEVIGHVGENQEQPASILSVLKKSLGLADGL